MDEEEVTYCVCALEGDPCWYRDPIMCDPELGDIDCPYHRHCTQKEYDEMIAEIERRRHDG